MTILNYFDELEPTVLIGIGFVLFVIPEPATSALGVGLMLLGIAWWFQEWRSPAPVDDESDGHRASPPRQ